jgi:hypothetical protein
VEFLDHAIVRTYEPFERQPECVEATLQTLNQQNLHELRQVALTLLLLFLDITLVISQRLIARISKVFCQQANGLKKYFIFCFIELVKQKQRISNVGKLEALEMKIFPVVLHDLGPRAPDHQMLEHLLTGSFCVALNGFKILFSIVMPVEAVEILFKLRKKSFKVAHIWDGAVLAILEQFDLTENVSRGIVHRCR